MWNAMNGYYTAAAAAAAALPAANSVAEDTASKSLVVSSLVTDVACYYLSQDVM